MPAVAQESKWSHRYGQKYRFVPILDDPELPNSRRGCVRIYRRGVHDGPGPHRFILNWYERGKNRKRTVLGDKFTAVTEADRINNRIKAAGRSGMACEKLSISQWVERFLEHQASRCDAGEISPGTVARYRSALGHVRQFAEDRGGVHQLRTSKIDDRFVLDLKAYLKNLEIAPNGHVNSKERPMAATGARFVLSTARAAWHWARKEKLLPAGTENPFRGHVGKVPPTDFVTTTGLHANRLANLIENCDAHQLTLLLPLVLYGLRAAEPCTLMIEDWQRDEGLLKVGCKPELGYQTKGRVDKVFPVPAFLHRVLMESVGNRVGGPLLLGRAFFEDKSIIPATLSTRELIVEEYRQRTGSNGSAQDRPNNLRRLLGDAGAVTYNQLDREFRNSVHRAGLGDGLTLKSLRHHFAGAMESANISYFTRKFLMGHRVRRDPLAIYTTTHVEQVRREFQRLLTGPMAPIACAARTRMEQLDLSVGKGLGEA